MCGRFVTVDCDIDRMMRGLGEGTAGSEEWGSALDLTGLLVFCCILSTWMCSVVAEVGEQNTSKPGVQASHSSLLG